MVGGGGLQNLKCNIFYIKYSQIKFSITYYSKTHPEIRETSCNLGVQIKGHQLLQVSQCSQYYYAKTKQFEYIGRLLNHKLSELSRQRAIITFIPGDPTSYLADQAKAGACSENTVVIHSFTRSESDLPFPSHSFMAPQNPNSQKWCFRS